MSRLRRFALLTLLLMTLAGCAGSQTAVGAGGADETPIPVEPGGGIGDGAEPLGDSATPDATPLEDTPIPVEPDGGIGDGAGPPGDPETAPAFGVSSETDSLSVEPHSSCWTDSTGAGICVDGIPTPGATPITAADQLVVTYEPGTLQATVAPFDDDQAEAGPPPAEDQTAAPVTVENPGIYLVGLGELAPGSYHLSLFWTGDQGDAAAALSLTVER